jgi:predicted flap endonuclease-1-like 5' DNA nuclease
MGRVHDIIAVHGVGEQRRGDTLVRFAKRFYKGVRWQVQEAGEDPNEVELFGSYEDNYMEVHYRDEIFRVWEDSWESSFTPPSAGSVLDWLGLWSSQFLNRAWLQWRGKESRPQARGPLSIMLWVPILLFALTLVSPLLAGVFWLWAARDQVNYQKEHNDEIDARRLIRYRFATGLALTVTTPLIVCMYLMARIGRAGAGLPIVGTLLNKVGQTIEDLVVGVLGDILLYVFDPIQAAFIRGSLEQKVQEARDRAKEEGREPSIHIIGHSMGSVIAYEVVSRSLPPDLRRSVKTLCTMGTVMDMVRYILGGQGLVQAERVRFSKDIPKEKQGDTYPRWLNLFARNDPATGFSPLLEFGQDPTNRPVCSTSSGHSTYWTDVRGVYRPFLAWVARNNPVFDKTSPPPPLSCQTSIVKDVRDILLKLAVLVGVIVVVAGIGAWHFDVSLADVSNELYDLARDTSLPWPLSWLVIGLAWLLARLITLILNLPGWYLKWLIGLGVALLVWAVLALPTLFRSLWRRVEYRQRAPLDRGASLNYWNGALEGIGAIYEVALRKQGIWTVHDFLVTAARPKGMVQLTRTLDVPEEWVKARARQANLMRLRGVGPRYAALLLAAEVDSMATLGQQERGELTERLKSRRDAVGLVSTPTEQEVEGWIQRAKTLRDVV